ncbi:MAG: hypothetical protein R3C20_15315 [Planctomycetaceae bacterium]
MLSKSAHVVGLSMPRAKYRQHRAVQYEHNTSPGGNFSRVIRAVADIFPALFLTNGTSESRLAPEGMRDELLNEFVLTKEFRLSTTFAIPSRGYSNPL